MLARTVPQPMPHPPARSITSRQNPIVSRFKRAARTADPELLVEGTTLIEEAARARWPMAVAAFTRAAFDASPQFWRELSETTECIEVSEAVLAALSPARTPSGAVALAAARSPALDDLVDRDQSLTVAAVGVQDPGNLGAIVRSAEALGASAVIACEGSADPFGWKALRGAMGSTFRLPVVRAADIDEMMAWAGRRGIRTIGLTLEGTPLSRVDLRGRTLVLLGAEGTGLPSSLAARVAQAVTIPMEPPVESLNVSVAAAVLMYEARRQREAGGRGSLG